MKTTKNFLATMLAVLAIGLTSASAQDYKKR